MAAALFLPPAKIIKREATRWRSLAIWRYGIFSRSISPKARDIKINLAGRLRPGRAIRRACPGENKIEAEK